MPYLPLVELTRGGIVESLHYGALAVADAQGRLVASYGDPSAVTFLRSTAKPFQAVPMVETGAADAFALSPREIALACASHKGMEMHAETARGIQEKIGAAESDLACGVQPPCDVATTELLLRAGQPPTANYHNCSGKHSGMLALARHHDWPLEGYLDPEHPVQRRILDTFADLCGLPADQVLQGTDGCSAPNFAVSLLATATAFARLADPSGLPHRRANALRTIHYAMSAYPEMISGPGGFDTELMRRRPGLIISKGGAEGYHGLALAPNALRPNSPALGLALKVSDGASRATNLAVLEVLRQLGALEDADFEFLAEFGYGPHLTLRNFRGLAVGEARAAFSLDFSGTGW
jgi:L-asparaginase II